MFNEFKNGSIVIVFGPGKVDDKYYKNVPATIIERDPFFKDYHIRLKDGTEDWVSSIYLRKAHSKRKKNKKRGKNNEN